MSGDKIANLREHLADLDLTRQKDRLALVEHMRKTVVTGDIPPDSAVLYDVADVKKGRRIQSYTIKIDDVATTDPKMAAQLREAQLTGATPWILMWKKRNGKVDCATGSEWRLAQRNPVTEGKELVN